MSTPGVGGTGQPPPTGGDNGVKGDASSFTPSSGGGTMGALKQQLIDQYGKKNGTKAYESIMKSMEISMYNSWKSQMSQLKAAEKRYGESFK